MKKCDQCALAWSVASLVLPSGNHLDLCGHHLSGVTAALDNGGVEYEVAYRTATA